MNVLNGWVNSRAFATWTTPAQRNAFLAAIADDNNIQGRVTRDEILFYDIQDSVNPTFENIDSEDDQAREIGAIVGLTGLNRRVTLRKYYTVAKSLMRKYPTLIDCTNRVRQTALPHQALAGLMNRWVAGALNNANGRLAAVTRQGNAALTILNQYIQNTGLDSAHFPGTWQMVQVFTGGAIGTSSLFVRHDGVNIVQDVSLPDDERDTRELANDRHSVWCVNLNISQQTTGTARNSGSQTGTQVLAMYVRKCQARPTSRRVATQPRRTISYGFESGGSKLQIARRPSTLTTAAMVTFTSSTNRTSCNASFCHHAIS